MTTERCVRPKRRKIKWMRILFICVMLAYPIFQLVLFWLAPNFDSLISAFIKINPRLGLREFSFSNFQKLFREFGTPDSQLMRGVINSFWYFVATVVVGIPLTILLAYFIYKKMEYRIFHFCAPLQLLYLSFYSINWRWQIPHRFSFSQVSARSDPQYGLLPLPVEFHVC